MITSKKKVCVECGKLDYIFSKKRCKGCSIKSYGKPKQISDKRKENGGSGELEVFIEKYKQVKGKCEITDEWLPFNPKHFMHILAKGSRPDLRLEISNIRHVKFCYHFGYDHVAKDIFLEEYPEAKIIYKWKEEAKYGK